MKNILAALLLLISLNAHSQDSAYTVSKDPKNDDVVFSGPITFADLDHESTFTWMKAGRDEYTLNAKAVAYLREHLPGYSILVFMGTWCGDSQDMIPGFEKVLHAVNYPDSALLIYGVDRTKETKDGASKKYKVKLVPTIILLKDGKEAGRITETVKKSVEADLVTIIKKDKSGMRK